MTINSLIRRYLALREFMNNNMPISWENFNSTENRGWYSNGERFKIDINKVKDDLTELEKTLFSKYVIDNTEKSE